MPPDRNPACIYVAGLAPGSRRAQAQALGVVASLLTGGRLAPPELPWHELRFQHAHAVRAALASRYAPLTCNRYLAALRGALKAAWRLGLMTSDEYRRAADVPPVRGTSPLAGREVSSDELRALLAACAQDPIAARGARDVALLATLAGTGCRLAEALGLSLADVDLHDDALRIGNGKGGKQRRVYLNRGTHEALASWMRHRGPEPGALFQPVASRVRRRRLSPQAVRAMLRRRAKQAGVPHLSPHDLRRTFAGDLLDAGADIATVAELMGHESIETTRRYDRRGERAKRAAIELRDLPSVG